MVMAKGSPLRRSRGWARIPVSLPTASPGLWLTKLTCQKKPAPVVVMIVLRNNIMGRTIFLFGGWEAGRAVSSGDCAGVSDGREESKLKMGYWLNRISLPGLNRTVFPGGMGTSAPVLGFLPIPLLRGFTRKTPKPLSSMRSPLFMDCLRALKTASTATSALTLVMPILLATRATISCLITASSYLSK